ncbi:MAG: glycosyltransferase [Zoogloeaceae bacterium]|jgi:glycosyltransferase involved in cell wall biosynthesis|nr:glycosyltransferase [Zoogloeaceae bacterium]
MKILFLVQKTQRIILDRLYEGVAAHCDCDLRWLEDDEQADLRGWFRRRIDLARYDRVLSFLRFKKEIRQWRFLRTIPNLVFLEHDAYQNYIPCKYTNKFSRHYARLPWARVLCSGAGVAARLQGEGIDAVFVPKGYDQTLFSDLGLVRDIELAFLGSTGSVVYSGRKALLEELGKVENLIIARTNSGDEYLQTLNRIRFFVSADVGMGEYMVKNFEAMACGCVLLAYDQGDVENNALGFVDMENLVLYRSLDDLRQKLAMLRKTPELAEKIAANGQKLAREKYTFATIGQHIVTALEAPLRPAAPLSWWENLRQRYGI